LTKGLKDEGNLVKMTKVINIKEFKISGNNLNERGIVTCKTLITKQFNQTHPKITLKIDKKKSNNL